MTDERPLPSTAARLATAGLVTAGVAIRVAVFASNRPLWLDEAWLANNIASRSVGQLFAPLADAQGAPILFLIAERLLWAAFHTDWSLRLVPLLSGCAALAMLPAVGRRFLPPWPVVLLTGLAAVSVPWVYYSSEVKQYSTDLAITLSLVVLAARWHDDRTPARGAALVAAGLVATWASHAAILVLGAVGLAMLSDAVRGRPDRRALSVTVVAGGLWTASVGVVYLVSLRHLEGDRGLRQYWEAGFPPYSPHVLAWAAEAGTDALRQSAGLDVPGLALVLAIVGGVAVWRRRPGGTAFPSLLLLLPFATALLAAAAHAYPFAGRLVLYLVPFELVLVVAGVTVVFASAEAAGRAGAVAAVVLLALGSVRELPTLFTRPTVGKAYLVTQLGLHRSEAARATVARIATDARPGDQVFLHGLAVPTYRYYVGRTPAAAAVPTTVTPYTDYPAGARSVLDYVRPGHRAWVSFYDVIPNPDVPGPEQVFTAAVASRPDVAVQRVGGKEWSLYLVTTAAVAATAPTTRR